jgi:hypothetical protein
MLRKLQLISTNLFHLTFSDYNFSSQVYPLIITLNDEILVHFY